MWNIKSTAFAALIFAGSAQGLPPVAPIVHEQTARTAVIAEFEYRVDQYVALHRLAEAMLPTVAFPNSPTEVKRATAQQRDAISRGRARAREGDLFTPQVAEYFRLVIANVRNGDFTTLIAETREEIEPLGTARINARWPGVTLTSMPPDLLAAFPPLPPEVEYRFVHHDLVLWDMHVDLVVDVLRNAIPVDAVDNAT